jgi:hypothetical protein
MDGWMDGWAMHGRIGLQIVVRAAVRRIDLSGTPSAVSGGYCDAC